ncbi:N-acetylmuramidase family protein [Adonisia turfae]|uniref:DUF3380 domain-containing protein n=1 Tax=Adonisia turfae CCMR0081 TaxID=2292702 RepID=A0A6M0RD39_9CYAN|nr:N-acetylmuramidase family protein [Adonisia turfae]NEZ54219.1 DUF3380 domain-containing protein [Adonisia turfae CCMR0081]
MNGIIFLTSVLAGSTKAVNSINSKASEKSLPPAFDLSNGNIKGNPDYRFEGFGVDFTGFLPPKPRLTFYVHFKKGLPQHVSLGKFAVPLSLSALGNVGHILDEDSIDSVSGDSIDTTPNAPPPVVSPPVIPIPDGEDNPPPLPPLFDSYLHDNRLNLKYGDIDTAGASRFGKQANVPGKYVVELQTHLTALGFLAGETDGWFGDTTRTALRLFQQASMGDHRHQNGNVIRVTRTFSGQVTGEADLSTREEMSLWLEKEYQRAQAPTTGIPISEFKYVYPPIQYANRQFIVTIPKDFVQEAVSDKDIEKAASDFGIEVAVLRAVLEVEASNSGFLLHEPPPARPKILFEAHIFYRETPEPVSRHRPDLATPSYTSRYYRGGSAEWERLLDAMKWDPTPALRSASWGLGQVMGFNFKAAGCDSVQQLVIEAHQGESQQMNHMLNYIRSNRLIPALQRPSINPDAWRDFSRGYNGRAYERLGYHRKLANAYKKWKARLG